jgi:hypothetical protein
MAQTARGNGHDADKARAESALFGSGEAFKTQAMEYIYEAAQTMPYKSYTQRAIQPTSAPTTPTAPIVPQGGSLLDSILDDM